MTNEAIMNPVFNANSGLMCDLEKTITPDEVRRLERLGYIENAISPKGETWKLSRKGRASRDLFLGKQSLFDRLSDFFYRQILGYRVSL